MGIAVRVREYTGEVIAHLDASVDILGLCDVAATEPTKFPMLSGIDRYDDTRFNSLQAVMMASELGLLSRQTEQAQVRDAVAALLPLVALLEPARGRPHHRRLDFTGD
ncbi:hypothetical protein AB0E63_06395 [Kribbella sp. NPDC026596]|uniref:hypothetical protein n=1 Tax=Kribbella sp. NPDC026596 TaxID=3155122 RepID=UPI0033C50380